jgi:hypothetical protein
MTCGFVGFFVQSVTSFVVSTLADGIPMLADGLPAGAPVGRCRLNPVDP